MTQKKSGLIFILFLAFIVLLNSYFVVDQRQQALLLQLGKVQAIIQEPGLKFKIPFVEQVSIFDKRVITLNAGENELILGDQKRVIVNAFAQYRIDDPLKYYQTVRDERNLESRLSSVMDSSLRRVFGSVSLKTLLTEKRRDVMKQVQELVSKQAAGFGISIADLRVVRMDLPEENSKVIYELIKAERGKEAKKLRAEGVEVARQIRANADKEKEIILANADKTSSIIRGEGDSTSTKIFADAFNKDPRFFEFYRTMQAYKKTLKSNNTTMLLSPDSDFLHMFQEPGKK